jgi:hypothetical protein
VIICQLRMAKHAEKPEGRHFSEALTHTLRQSTGPQKPALSELRPYHPPCHFSLLRKILTNTGLRVKMLRVFRPPTSLGATAGSRENVRSGWKADIGLRV